MKDKNYTIIPHNHLRFTPRVNTLIDCMGCFNIFEYDELSVVDAIIRGKRDIYILCQKCYSQYKC